jgi:hypothetical protein
MTRKFEKYKRKTKILMACCKKLSVFGRPVVRGFVKMNFVEGVGSRIEIPTRRFTEGFEKSNK